MKDAPAFDFYPERWLAGVAEMSNIDQLVYLRLLCHSWLRDGLPDDVELLSRLAGASVSPVVLGKFPLGDDGVRRNARLEVIRAAQRARIASRRRGAMKTNSKRWNKQVTNESLGDRSATVERFASDSLSDRSATVERFDGDSPPPTTHPKEKASSAKIAEAIANAYPRRDAPVEVLEFIMNDLDSGQNADEMLGAVQQVAAVINSSAPGGAGNKYVPNALNFFRGRQWRSPEAFSHRWSPKKEAARKQSVLLTTKPNNGW